MKFKNISLRAIAPTFRAANPSSFETSVEVSMG
jgi:hypothetical protein